MAPRGAPYKCCQSAAPPLVADATTFMGAWQWYQSEFMAVMKRKPYNQASPGENKPTALTGDGNAPLLSPVGDVSPQESMSLDFRVASLPYKSSSFATPEGQICSMLTCRDMWHIAKYP